METKIIDETLIKFKDNKPKYSQFENERKWLVSRDVKSKIEGTWHYQIIDRYIVGSKIRLRSATDSETGKSIYKLTKKYGIGDCFSEPISSFYISRKEYDLFKDLPHKQITKKRHLLKDGDIAYSIDVFEEDHSELILAEVEAPDIKTLMSIPMPSFAIKEVTEDSEYSGGYLAFNSIK